MLLAGDIDASEAFRRLFNAMGVDLSRYGAELKDYHNNI
jgi:hypothetical protein